MGHLRASGCRVLLSDRSFQMQMGLLVIARGARSGTGYSLDVSEVQDGVVSVTLQTGREQKTRHLSFTDAVQSFVDTEVERFCSRTQQVSSELVTDLNAMT